MCVLESLKTEQKNLPLILLVSQLSSQVPVLVLAQNYACFIQAPDIRDDGAFMGRGWPQAKAGSKRWLGLRGHLWQLQAWWPGLGTVHPSACSANSPGRHFSMDSMTWTTWEAQLIFTTNIIIHMQFCSTAFYVHHNACKGLPNFLN